MDKDKERLNERIKELFEESTYFDIFSSSRIFDKIYDETLDYLSMLEKKQKEEIERGKKKVEKVVSFEAAPHYRETVASEVENPQDVVISEDAYLTLVRNVDDSAKIILGVIPDYNDELYENILSMYLEWSGVDPKEGKKDKYIAHAFDVVKINVDGENYKLFRRDAITSKVIEYFIENIKENKKNIGYVLDRFNKFLIGINSDKFDLEKIKSLRHSQVKNEVFFADNLLKILYQLIVFSKNLPINKLSSAILSEFKEDIKMITYGRLYNLRGIASSKSKGEYPYSYVWGEMLEGNKGEDYYSTKDQFFAFYHFAHLDDEWKNYNILGNLKHDARALIFRLKNDEEVSIIFPPINHEDIEDYLKDIRVVHKSGDKIERKEFDDFIKKDKNGSYIEDIFLKSLRYYGYKTGRYLRDLLFSMVEFLRYKEPKRKVEKQFNELVDKLYGRLYEVLDSVSPHLFFVHQVEHIINVDNIINRRYKSFRRELSRAILGRAKKMNKIEKAIRSSLASISFVKSDDKRPLLASASIVRRFYSSPNLISAFPTLHPVHRQAHRVDDSGGIFDINMYKGYPIPDALKEHLEECHGYNYFPHFHTDDEELLKREFYLKSNFGDEWEINTLHLNLHREDHIRLINNKTHQAPDFNVVIKGELLDPYLAEHIKRMHGKNYIHHPLPMPHIKEDEGFIKSVLSEELSKYFNLFEVETILSNEDFIKSVKEVALNKNVGALIEAGAALAEEAAPVLSRISPPLIAAAKRYGSSAFSRLESVSPKIATALRYGSRSIFDPQSLSEKILGDILRTGIVNTAKEIGGEKGGELASSAIDLGRDISSGKITENTLRNFASSMKNILPPQYPVEKAEEGDLLGSVLIGVAEDGEEVYGELCADDYEERDNGVVVVRNGYVKFNNKEYPVSGVIIYNEETGSYYPEDLMSFFGGAPIIEGESENCKLKVVRV